MMQDRLRLFALVLAASALIAGCAGGSTHGTTGSVPLAAASKGPTSAPLAAVPPGTVAVTLTLAVPQHSQASKAANTTTARARLAQSGVRLPKFIPSETNNAVATVTSGGIQVSSASAPCSSGSTCTLTIGVPPGVASTLVIDLQGTETEYINATPTPTAVTVAMATVQFPASGTVNGISAVQSGVANTVSVVFQPVIGYAAVNLAVPGEGYYPCNPNVSLSNSSAATQSTYYYGVVAGYPKQLTVWVNMWDILGTYVCGATGGYVDSAGNVLTSLILSATSHNGSPSDVHFAEGGGQTLTIPLTSGQDPTTTTHTLDYVATYNAGASAGYVTVTPSFAASPNPPTIPNLDAASIPSFNGTGIAIIGPMYTGYDGITGAGPTPNPDSSYGPFGGPYVAPSYSGSGQLSSALAVEFPAPPGGPSYNASAASVPFLVYDLGDPGVTASPAPNCAPPVVDAQIPSGPLTQASTSPSTVVTYSVPFDGTGDTYATPAPGGNGTCTVTFSDSANNTATLTINVNAPNLIVEGAKRK